MKKISSIVFLLAATTLFTGCVNEEDDLFDKSAAERLNEISKIYTERLSAPAAGWVLEYYPTPDVVSPTDDYALKTRGYMLLAKFDKGGSVDMGIDISNTDFAQNYLNTNIFGGYVADKSTWNVITDMGPVLSFNSYNKCIHIFSDPAIFQTGTGLEGDYEFVIIDLPEDGDIAMLKGKKRGTYIRMAKLDEGTDFETYTKEVNDFTNKVFSPQAPNNCVMRLGEETFSIESAATGIMNIYPYDGDNIADEDFYPYLITKRGGKFHLRFRDKLKKGTGDESIQEFVYNEEKDTFYDIDNEANVIEGENPLAFFYGRFDAGQKWSWIRNTESSDYMADLNNRIYTEAKTAGYTITRIELRKNEAGEMVCAIGYSFRQGRVTVSGTATYLYNMTTEGENGITLSYKGSGEVGGETLYSTIPSIKEFIDCLSTAHTIEAQTTRFNLNTINIAAANDASKWFVVTLSN